VKEAIAASPEMINQWYIVSKNVCHRVTFAKEVASGYDPEGVGIGVSLDSIEKHWRSLQSVAPEASPAAGAFHASYGLQFFIDALREYCTCNKAPSKADKKMLHDLVAGLAGVHLGYSGVAFRRVTFEWKEGGDPSLMSGKKSDQSAKDAAKKKENEQKQQETQEFQDKRNKNGGEWGCVDATNTKQPAFVFLPDQDESKLRRDDIDNVDDIVEFEDDAANVFISVDISLDDFLRGLLGSQLAEAVLGMRE